MKWDGPPLTVAKGLAVRTPRPAGGGVARSCQWLQGRQRKATTRPESLLVLGEPWRTRAWMPSEDLGQPGCCDLERGHLLRDWLG